MILRARVITLAAGLLISSGGCQASGPSGNAAPLAARGTAAAPSGARAPGDPWESDPHDLGAFIDWKDATGPLIGSRIGQSYTVATELGVIHTENGKPADKIWERWAIQCSSGSSGIEPNCSVDRIGVSGILKGPLVTTDHFSTFNQTIKNLKLKWEDGAIDFAIVESFSPLVPETSPTEVAIRFQWKNDYMYLVSLDGTGWERDLDFDHKGQTKLMSFHYTVPEYTFTLNVPLIFQGMNSAGVRAWREMERTLSPEDQGAWADLARHRDDFSPDSKQVEAQSKAALGETPAGGKLAPEQERKLNAIFVDAMVSRFRERLARSPMSKDGQQKVLHFLEARLRE